MDKGQLEISVRINYGWTKIFCILETGFELADIWMHQIPGPTVVQDDQELMHSLRSSQAEASNNQELMDCGRKIFYPKSPRNHDQYQEHHTSVQQSAVDPSHWVQHLSSTGVDSIPDPQTGLSSLPRTNITHQTDQQQTNFKGFKRKDDLTEHRNRVHEANARASVVASHDSKPSTRAEPIEDEEMENASPSSALVAIKDGFGSNLSPKEFLLAKLAELQGMRMKLMEEKDEGIRAVEKTLSLM
ncbi:hypothetical protein BHYA_0054g00250 [Botrytis hyacinthi]|uniref:Uncharacterized protein n=1 Tax=Botrytis hyacinthi TaxID=278943 RepID=A0A4Z1GUJ6_9HELO|nr:hypothetical protein BHYA_0054g00250 [Botrytis hyacinthi]